MALLVLIAPQILAHEEETHIEHSDDHHHEDVHADNDIHSHHLAEVEGFRVLHGWTNTTRQDTTLVFMELENTGEATITLLDAKAELAAQSSLVGFRLVDGSPSYEPLHSVPVSPGRKMQLTPNGLAIELKGLSEPSTRGQHFDMEIHTSLGNIYIHVDVESASAMQHSHAGYAH